MPSSTMFAFLISALALGNIVQASSPSWTVYHSWNADQEFSRRGELKWSPEEGSLQIANDDELLSKESVQAMLEYGWYHVKIENSFGDFVLSTVPACSIRRANFKDEFQVTLPRTQESQITSLAYLPLASPLAPKSCDEMGEVESPAFTSKVSLTLDTPGMVLKAVLPTTKPPPGMSFISHPNLKKNAGAGKTGGGGAKGGEGQIPGPDQEPPQSFMRRYWYIILPLMIANFMGGGPEAPAPDQGGDGSQQQSGEGGGAAAAPIASGSSSKKRRGKR